MSPEEEMLLTCIPLLIQDSGYTVSRTCTRDYNCIAWAIERDDVWYWPYLGNEHEDDEYWPNDAPDDERIESFIVAMKHEGFELCKDACFEEDYTKIALYEKQGNCTHASRQLSQNMWTSKLGPLHDVSHSSPYSVEGDFYGKVYCFMKRKRF